MTYSDFFFHFCLCEATNKLIKNSFRMSIYFLPKIGSVGLEPLRGSLLIRVSSDPGISQSSQTITTIAIASDSAGKSIAISTRKTKIARLCFRVSISTSFAIKASSAAPASRLKSRSRNSRPVSRVVNKRGRPGIAIETESGQTIAVSISSNAQGSKNTEDLE